MSDRSSNNASLEVLATGTRNADPEAIRLIGEGNKLEDLGRLDEALACYESALRIAPSYARAHLNRGNVLLEMGHSEAARVAYAETLRLDPLYAGAHFNLGNAHARSGQWQSAESCYRRAIELGPEFADAEVALAGTLAQLGRDAESIEALDRALHNAPDHALARKQLGEAQARLQRFDEAVLSFRYLLNRDPDDADLYVHLGDALAGAGRFSDAVAVYEQGLALEPRLVLAHYGAGRAHFALGDHTAALHSFQGAIDLAPDFAFAHNNLATAAVALGKLDVAVAGFTRAVELAPGSALGYFNLANAFRDLGEYPAALANYKKALGIDPNYADALNNLGAIQMDLGHLGDAVASYRHAIQIRPEFAEAHSNLGNALRASGYLEDAAASYRAAIAINPAFADAHGNLGTTLCDLGALSAAAVAYRNALQVAPAYAAAHSGLLFCLSHDEAVEADALYAEHRRFGEHFEGPLRAGWPVHANVADPGRCLQVGLVSGDFRAHPMAHFIEPLLVQLARRSSLSLHVYNNHAVDDHVTERLRGQVQNWHRVAGLSDEALARLVMQHRIDVLIDLSGHTSENRLLTFARKPAPIQASWIGYLGTTGLRAMDYYFADRHLFPLDPFAGQFTEKLVHLPASAPFLPDADAPPVNALPALSSGHITFGSFNHPRKLRPPVIALWAQLLRALPRAQLLLGALPPDGQQEQLLELFAHEGIARERIGLHARCPTAEYLRLHHRVDICLDTFPYAGGATNAHALWMGVPTLTMAGRTPVGRLGAALMSQVGLDDYVAQDAADYVRKGVALAADLPALARTRTELRARCAQTPSRQPEVIAAGFERALRIMWERWCQGLPAKEFEVD